MTEMILTNAAYIPFLLIIIIMSLLMLRAHISSQSRFNLYETLIDASSGKASLERVGMWFAILSITWWFIDKSAKGTATWEDMLAYAGVLGLTNIAASVIAAKYKG